jgi:hypothetical protein
MFAGEKKKTRAAERRRMVHSGRKEPMADELVGG